MWHEKILLSCGGTAIIQFVRSLPEKRHGKYKRIFLIIPITAALFESQQVCKRCGIGSYLEAVLFPRAYRHPREGDVEAVQVISGVELCRGEFLRYEIISGRGVDVQPRSELDVAGHVQGRGVSVLLGEHFGAAVVRVRTRIAEAGAEIQ